MLLILRNVHRFLTDGRCAQFRGHLESTRRFVAANASRRRSEEFRKVEPAEISRRETNEIPRFFRFGASAESGGFPSSDKLQSDGRLPERAERQSKRRRCFLTRSMRGVSRVPSAARGEGVRAVICLVHCRFATAGATPT